MLSTLRNQLNNNIGVCMHMETCLLYFQYNGLLINCVYVCTCVFISLFAVLGLVVCGSPFKKAASIRRQLR